MNLSEIIHRTDFTPQLDKIQRISTQNNILCILSYAYMHILVHGQTHARAHLYVCMHERMYVCKYNWTWNYSIQLKPCLIWPRRWVWSLFSIWSICLPVWSTLFKQKSRLTFLEQKKIVPGQNGLISWCTAVASY